MAAKQNGTAASVEEMQAQIEALKAQLAQKNKLSLKVSEKGAVSVYGLGRFPVTLYKEQWERLIGFIPEIEKFIAAHASKLSVKEQ
jgi:hypothetical protein